MDLDVGTLKPGINKAVLQDQQPGATDPNQNRERVLGV